MADPDRLERLLRERRDRAQRVAKQQQVADTAATLRSFYHPKQSAFYRSGHRRRATNKTRRSGATAGGCRELIARAIETPRFRAVYLTSTRVDAQRRAWANDTQSGFVDVLRHYGSRVEGSVETIELAGLRIEVRAADLAIVFSNGSLIELFGADDEAAINRMRGLTKHVWWIDEAQDFIWLERLYKAVITAGATDFGGEIWLTGTPGRDCAGFFYEVTRDDGDGMPGWEIHRIAVTDNPFFGAVLWEAGQWFVVDNLGERYGPFATGQAADEVAIKVRWERTAGAAIRDNQWDEDDPDLLREWYARWVKEDARFVYDLHKVNEPELVYAPTRLAEDGFPDIRAALLDLPGWKEERQYFLGIGIDLGTTRAFAWSLWGWSLQDPCLYEVASWKKAGLDYEQMAAVLRVVADQTTIGMWVADAGGGGKPAVKGWSREWMSRYSLPINEAEKANKRLAIKQMNSDIRRLWLRMRKDSPLLAEWRRHRWLPMRGTDATDIPGGTAEDPRTHRDLSDAGLYIHRHSYHHRYRPEDPPVVHGTPEWVKREEQELEGAAFEEFRPYGYG